MKLAVKIIGATVLVAWVALATASWLIDRNTARTYRLYLDQAQARQLGLIAAQVQAYYADGVDLAELQIWLDAGAFTVVPGMGPMGAMPRMRSRGHMMDEGMAAPQVILVDPVNGIPLSGTGLAATPAQRSAAIPIRDGEQTVALLIPAEAGTRIGQAEQTVLSQVQRAILMSAGLAGLIAVGLGGLVVWTLLRPLSALQQGVAAVSRGDLSAAVPVTSNDELGQLASAFNAMSAKLRRQESLRRQLLADVAHELRTPLSVVQGNLQAMLDGVYPLTSGEVQTVFDETRLLSRLVDDLHELAQAEAGALALQRQPLSVGNTLERMAALFAPVMSARNVTLRVHRPEQDVLVSADPDRLQQILHNLLGNALRHTPAGGTIELSAEPGEDATGPFVRFAVRDTGPGIPAEHLPRVFDRFYRVDPSRRRAETVLDNQTAGVGLGLAIVRALVEAHQGRVGVTNHDGLGAEFWLELPLAPPHHNLTAT